MNFPITGQLGTCSEWVVRLRRETYGSFLGISLGAARRSEPPTNPTILYAEWLTEVGKAK